MGTFRWFIISCHKQREVKSTCKNGTDSPVPFSHVLHLSLLVGGSATALLVCAVVIACTKCHTGCFDITTLEELHASLRRARANLASLDKGLDMMGTHCMMAMLANNLYCCCRCNPIITHSAVSFFLAQSSGFML